MPPALRTWRLPAWQGGVGVQERRVGHRPAGERGREGAQGVSEGERERAHPPPLDSLQRHAHPFAPPSPSTTTIQAHRRERGRDGGDVRGGGGGRRALARRPSPPAASVPPARIDPRNVYPAKWGSARAQRRAARGAARARAPRSPPPPPPPPQPLPPTSKWRVSASWSRVGMNGAGDA